MPAARSSSRWILLAAGSCAVLGVVLKLADRDGSDEASKASQVAAEPASAARRDPRAPIREPGDVAGSDVPREADDAPAGGERIARAPGSGEFPTLLGPGFQSNHMSPARARRLQRKAERKAAREARRQARLDARSVQGQGPAGTPSGAPGGPGAQPGAPAQPPAAAEQPVPVATGNVFQSDAAAQYTLDTPFDLPDATKLAGRMGSVAFWLQPQWQDGNQDDATFFDISGQLQLIKNVNFLRFEYTDEQGQIHGIGFPITDWKAGDSHLVATSWNGNVFQLYVDGQLATQATLPNILNLPTDTAMTIGSDFPVSRPVAPGTMNGLDVQNRPLSPAEVLALFRAGTSR